MNRKIVILTEGLSNPHQGKLARNLLLYKPEEVAAVLDKYEAGKQAKELFLNGEHPVVASLDDVPEADTLVIGVATPGGVMPESYKEIVLDAISRKMNIICGLHRFLNDDPDFVRAAEQHGVTLTDLRRNTFKKVVNREGFNPDCLRIQTVGNDCSLGKMVTSMEIAVDMRRKGYDTGFAPTGQTGILLEGRGIPIDAVQGDFINGAAENIVLQNQDHDYLIIEGQASLVHPRYSSVTLGLLHGAQPHGLIMCYEIGRKVIHGVESFAIPPLAKVMEYYEIMANIMHPCKIIGLAINGRKVSGRETDEERERVKKEFGLPACDVIRHGPDELTEAVVNFREELKLKLLVT